MITVKESERNEKGSADEQRQLERFVRSVLGAKDTPDLIRLLASDGALLSLCKEMLGMTPESAPKRWQHFGAACRRWGVAPERIRERLGPAARSLGLLVHGVKQVDYYGVLEVDPSASAEEIQRAYHQKAKRLHPDTHTEGSKDGAAIRRLNEAYSVLKDPTLRRHYDESRRSMEAWCEFPDSTYPDATSRSRALQRIRQILQIAGLVGVLLILTLIFSDLYRHRSMQDGFQEIQKTHVKAAAVPLEKPAASLSKSTTHKPEENPPASGVREAFSPESEKGNPAPRVLPTTGFSSLKDKKSEKARDEKAMKPLNKPEKDLPRLSEKAKRKKAVVLSDSGEKPGYDAILEKVMQDVEKRRRQRDAAAEAIPVAAGKKAFPVPEATSVAKTPETKEASELPTAKGVREPKKPPEASTLSDARALAMVEKLADETEEIERIKAFIRSYCKAYEKRDLGVFSRYFSEDAVENGKAFSTLAPEYRRTFATVDQLDYQIQLYRFSHLIDRGIYRVRGTYHIAWRRHGGTPRAGNGEIAFELVKENGSYRVKTLTYSAIQENR